MGRRIFMRCVVELTQVFLCVMQVFIRTGCFHLSVWHLLTNHLEHSKWQFRGLRTNYFNTIWYNGCLDVNKVFALLLFNI